MISSANGLLKTTTGTRSAHSVGFNKESSSREPLPDSSDAAKGAQRGLSERLKLLRLRLLSQLFPTPKATYPSATDEYILGPMVKDKKRRTVIPLETEKSGHFCSNKYINSRYTFYNFLFKNLFEQFKRPLNMYFLLVTVLQFISIIAPVSPLTTLLPLVFAFLLTACKEGYDDIKRHRQDYLYNSRKIMVLKNGSWTKVESQKLKVGDIILLKRNEEIPADLVGLMGPPDSAGIIYIRTDNMDGEIEWKARDVLPLRQAVAHSPVVTSPTKVPAFFPATVVDNPQELVPLVAGFSVDAPPPLPMPESFDGRLLYSDEKSSGEPGVMPISYIHLLPQSCLIKSDYVIGLIVYTGKDTKSSMNKSETPAKWAKIDRQVNYYAIVIFCLQVSVSFILGMLGLYLGRNRDESREHWYITPSEDTPLMYFIYPLRYFLLTTIMIPISFKFIVDVNKYFLALVIEWDDALVDTERGIRAAVRNSSIVEDLGQVQYILSDKTGTITCNMMQLREVSISGQRIKLSSNPTPPGPPTLMSIANGDQGTSEHSPVPDDYCLFWRTLALCNNVEVRHTEGQGYTYQSASPDEEALCRAAAGRGATLTARSKFSATLLSNLSNISVNEEWDVYHVFSFSSEKKSMSVLVRSTITNKIYLLAKGADDVLMNQLSLEFLASQKGSELVRKTTEDLDAFARLGLRTLVICARELGEEELDSFKKRLRDAQLAIEGRQEYLDSLRREMEQNYVLIGATAIEDELQEGVVGVMQDLLEANIKVWMLTGDKIETAHQIALSCGLMAPDDNLIELHGPNWESKLMSASVPEKRPPQISQATLVKLMREADNSKIELLSSISSIQPLCSFNGERGEFTGKRMDAPTSLIVQGGDILDSILRDSRLRDRFLSIGANCRSVVCARVTPLQKAQVTRLVRCKGKITLAIGDGGNDVAMIHGAHVGVGIIGREGQQAARAADFAIAKFRHLRSLLFVHGHQAISRTAFVVQYSFYKSMLVSFIQLVFNATSTYMTGTSFWNSFSLMTWNGVYTLPPTMLYVMDRCAPRVVLEDYPVLYRVCQRGEWMTKLSFIFYLLLGISQSVITLLFLYFSLSFTVGQNGQPEALDTTFTIGYTALVMMQVPAVCLGSNSIGPINLFMILLMPVAYYAITIVYSSLEGLRYYGVFVLTFPAMPQLVAFAIGVGLVLPHAIFVFTKRILMPEGFDALRAAEINRMREAQQTRILCRISDVSTRASGILSCLKKARLTFKLLLLSYFTAEQPSRDLRDDVNQGII